MKKIITLLFLAFFLNGFSQIPTPTLNFGIGSHVEPAEDFTNAANYNRTRDTLKKIVDLIFAKNAKYNMQLMPNFVQGALTHEMAATTSTDIIEYAYNIGGTPAGVVQIDPRYKTTALYNIADVSYSIGLTGAQASKVVGGFIHFNATPPPGTYTLGDWIPYTTTITAQNTPTYTWKANIIWGAGSLPPHVKDANNYGVWKPRGKNDSIDFYCHDPAQNVWVQGNGCSWVLTPTTNVNALIADIRNEATKIKNGTYPANKFYNGNLMINFKDFGTSTVSPTFQMPATLSIILDSINVMVSQGKINWKTIDQKQAAFSAWSSSTSITHSQWKCGQTVTLTPTCAPNTIGENLDLESFGISVYPNPASNTLYYEWQNSYFTNANLKLYDNLGKCVLKKSIADQKGSVNIEQLPKGLYFISIENSTGQSKPQKLVISK